MMKFGDSFIKHSFTRLYMFIYIGETSDVDISRMLDDHYGFHVNHNGNIHAYIEIPLDSMKPRPVISMNDLSREHEIIGL